MAQGAGTVGGAVPSAAWRRLSPLSPLLNSWSTLVVVFSVLFIQGAQNLAGLSAAAFVDGRSALIVALGGAIIFLGVALAIGVYSWLAWNHTAYALTDDAVWFRKGIFFKTERRARLERVQAVDVIRPLVGRIFGVGKIAVEVAGSSGSSLTFGYLKNAELVGLRTEILARAARLASHPHQATQHGLPGQVAPQAAQTPEWERPLYRVETGRLLGATLLSMGVWVALFIGVVFFVTAVGSMGAGTMSVLGLVTFLPVMFGVVSLVASRLIPEYNFRATITPGGIRIRRGLLETRTQTIPPRRVHAVRISQPLLWRLFGWFRVVIDQAGYEAGRDSQSRHTSNVLLPVGTETEALLALWLVLPDLGVPDPARFVRTALKGQGPAEGFTVNPPRSSVLDPLVFRRRGIAMTGTCLVFRDGRVARSAAFVPYARIQSMGVQQGPVQRSLRLATVAAHTVPGPVRPQLPHLSNRQTELVVEQVAKRAHQQRVEESADQWWSRTAALGLGADHGSGPGPSNRGGH